MEVEELLIRAKKGDKNAYGKLYRLYYARIYRYCSIQLSHADSAQDMCQETFIRAWKALPSFSLQTDGTFQAYLFRIAHNCIIDLWRKKKTYSLEEATHIEHNESFEENLDAQETITKLKHALSLLNDTDKQIILLRYFEELSHMEIAKIMHSSDGAIRGRTMRIVQKLKKIVQKHG